MGDALYKAGVSAPLLRCVAKPEGRAILEEIRRGECGLHASARALVGKAFRQGFYWPTALRDAQQLMQHCDPYYRMAKKSCLPTTALQPIVPVWPLARWGVDIVGPLPMAREDSDMPSSLLNTSPNGWRHKPSPPLRPPILSSSSGGTSFVAPGSHVK